MSASPRPSRARENRTRYVALGMLTFQPMSVYALRQAIGGSVGHFWAESYGQLYPTLRRLSQEGLVTARATPGARGREATVYQVTRAGRAALAEWVSRPAAPEQVRSEILVKLFFGAAVAPEVVDRNLEAAAAGFRARLAALEQISARWGDHMARDPRGPYGWLTLDYGLLATRTALEWLDRARAHVLPRGAGAPASRKVRRRGSR